MSDAPAPQGSNAVRIAGILVGVGGVLGILPAIGFAFLSIFMFDAPGSQDNALTWALAYGLWALTPAVIVMAVLGFMAAGRRNPRLLGAAFAIPVVFIVYFVVVSSMLEHQCGGRFAC